MHCLIEHHAMKTYQGISSKFSLILNLGTYMEVSGHFYAPATLPPEKEPPVPIG
jgi:hypothetical protein